MSLASRDFLEKRNFIRMKVETPISLRYQHSKHLKGTCHNLSGGGLLVSIPEPIAVGEEVEVTVSSNHGHNPMLKAVTKVTRSYKEAEYCHLGLSITAVAD